MNIAEILQAAAERGLRLRAIGASLRGPCPFHGGKNPTSFSITPSVGLYQCFSCGAHGDLRLLVDILGVPVREQAEGTSGERAGAAGEVRPFYDLDPAHPYLASRGVDPETAHMFGMGGFRGAGAFARRIIVPLHDGRGRLVGHMGRAIDDVTEPRYRFQRGTPKGRILYNLHRADRSLPVIVVEGVFDLLAVRRAGGLNVVALLGAHASHMQTALLRVFPRVALLLDADDAGRAGTRDLTRALRHRAVALVLLGADPATTATDDLRAALLQLDLTRPNRSTGEQHTDATSSPIMGPS